MAHWILRPAHLLMLSLLCPSVSAAATQDSRFDKSWLSGLREPGLCETLAPDPAFIGRLPASERVRRVALVIGNSNYLRPEWKLPNPGNDAVAVARLLQAVGFEVQLLRDGTANAIQSCAKEVAKSPADLSVVYYSGHGIQREYTNYLVATDVSGFDATLGGLVSLDKLIADIRGASRALLVFLDACRNNPVASSNTGAAGLAAEQVVPRGMNAASGGTPKSAVRAQGGQTSDAGAALKGGELFIAFSTSPNAVAADGTGDFSPFTQAFLRHATTPGWSVPRVLAEVTKTVGEATDWAQTPWTRSSLTTQIYFNGGVDPAEAQRASNLKAKQSQEKLAHGDRTGAIIEALRGFPEAPSDTDAKTYSKAYEALYLAVRSRSLQLPIEGNIHPTFSHDGKRLATVSGELGSSSRKEALKIWDVETRALIAELLPTDRSGTAASTLMPATFSGDSRFVAHIDPKAGRPVVWDAASGVKVVELPKIPGVTLPMDIPPRISLSAKGKFVLISDSSRFHVYDVESKKIVANFKSNEISAYAAVSPDETLLVVAGSVSNRGQAHQVIRIDGYDIASKKKLWSREVREETWGVYGVHFSPDGKRVGLTTSGDAIVMFDIASGQISRIGIPRAGSAGLSFSPDSEMLAVTPEDESGMQPAIRKIATGEELQLPYGQTAILDLVHNLAGEVVGSPWYPDAGDIWRKGPVGAALYAAAKAALSEEQLVDAGKDRVKFR